MDAHPDDAKRAEAPKGPVSYADGYDSDDSDGANHGDGAMFLHYTFVISISNSIVRCGLSGDESPLYSFPPVYATASTEMVVLGLLRTRWRAVPQSEKTAAAQDRSWLLMNWDHTISRPARIIHSYLIPTYGTLPVFLYTEGTGLTNTLPLLPVQGYDAPLHLTLPSPLLSSSSSTHRIDCVIRHAIQQTLLKCGYSSQFVQEHLQQNALINMKVFVIVSGELFAEKSFREHVCRYALEQLKANRVYLSKKCNLCLYATGKTTGINIVVGDATKNETTEIAFVHDQFQIGKTLLLKTVDAVELEANLLQIFDLWKANSWHDGEFKIDVVVSGNGLALPCNDNLRQRLEVAIASAFQRSPCPCGKDRFEMPKVNMGGVRFADPMAVHRDWIGGSILSSLSLEWVNAANIGKKLASCTKWGAFN